MRFSFLLKAAATCALVFLFDRLFPIDAGGATVGVFAGAWLLALLATRRDVRARRGAWVAVAFATLFAVALFDASSGLAWVLFWSALSVAALLPRAAGFDDAWRWSVRLLLHGASGPLKLLMDLHRLATRPRAKGVSARALVATLALPVIGGGVFVALFAAANPLVEQAFTGVSLPPVGRVVLCAVVALLLWPAFRPQRAVLRAAAALPDPEPRIPGTSLPSVLLALGLFNLLFAVQNGLDIAFLWSGAPLPEGMSAAEYAHRGAYPLIGTAALAGFLALAMLRPGSASAANPWARRLVTLWVAQNLVLVASSVLRTLDYIGESMLTAWRIAALLWMGLVALGLILICWRILAQRSARWLINGNALAGGLVLSVCAFVDLGATAAQWSVDHGRAGQVDLCYLRAVGDGALLPVIALERRTRHPALRAGVRAVRVELYDDLAWRQSRWTSWTPRGARRLSAARALAGDRKGPADRYRRDCRGLVIPSSPVPSVQP
ncbi:DUF4173 domain-containing protein [Sphingomonas hankookensis]|uniref:DUF4153 domain-containing protein n=1 Tax=Sphingomonas hankookensis TaxID=563996 RepID=UPI001F5A2C70|nr:DUF4173 domain-containing protein [Sphingomonas hankookensis]